jgi:hypothetical protein
VIDPEEYLRDVERGLCGSRAAQKRLLTELRDHIDDALEADRGHADDVMARVGAPDDVVTPWRSHTVAVRAQNRRRAAVLALAVATTAALGIAQHAWGHRTPRNVCSASQPSDAGAGSFGCLRGDQHGRPSRPLP